MTSTANPPNESKLLHRTLAIVAAIADVTALCILAAQFLRQDIFLVLAIVGILMAGTLTFNWLFQHKFFDCQNLFVLGAICISSIILAIFFWASLRSIKVSPIHLTIDEPKDASEIEEYRYLVKGTVSDVNSKVYVVVRPFETLDYWVQEPPTVDAYGNWQVYAYFGEKGIGIGDKYEVIALATDENFLVTRASGNYLQLGKTNSIPTNTNRSNFVTVTRTR